MSCATTRTPAAGRISPPPAITAARWTSTSRTARSAWWPTPANKAKKISHLVKYFHTVKPNRFEAEALCGFKINTDEDLKKAARFFLDQGVENVFISLDADGIYYLTKEEEGKLAFDNKIDVKNVTGAGDSFVAGLGYGYMNKLSTIDTLKYAVAMSLVTITHEENINPNMRLF